MLIEREYKPASNEILYHYCSADTFHAICSGKKLRFCDLFSMNDFMEMHWGYQVWEQAATELLPKYGKEFLDEIDEFIHSSGLKFLPLASCFSKESDVLSQWRAYAKDGTGFSIGFNASMLSNIPARALKVLYVYEKQVNEVKDIIVELHKFRASDNKDNCAIFSEMCLKLSFDLASLKNPAFSEENEVRLIYLVEVVSSNNSFKLVDYNAKSENIAGTPINFFMRDNIPAGFLDIDFTNNGTVNPISEVIIGPKNQALVSAISIYLETKGIDNVKVRRSQASYR